MAIAHDDDLQLIGVVCPSQNAVMYAEIKLWCTGRAPS
jgi:hypothetical protein